MKLYMFINLEMVNLFFCLVKLNGVDKLFCEVLSLELDIVVQIGDLEGRRNFLSESSYFLYFDSIKLVSRKVYEGRQVVNEKKRREVRFYIIN